MDIPHRYLRPIDGRINRLMALPCLALVLGLGLAGALSARTLVHAGQVIDGRGERALAERTIIIEDGRITGVRAGYVQAGPADQVIDLRGHWVMPGLIDSHTHLTSQQNPDNYLQRFTLSEADVALRSAAFARRTLMAGFTTVRDLGDSHNASVALRNAINSGTIAGPRIYTAAKSIATTGGHADPTNGARRGLLAPPGPPQGVGDGPDALRRAVRQRYKDGADLIKITATGGVLSVAKSGQNPQFQQDELQAVVDTAKDYGMAVAVHAHGTEGMRRAIEAGVDSIEHATYMTPALMAMMKRRGVYYVPTLLAGAWVAEKARIDGFFPELVRPKAATIGPLLQKTFAEAVRRGVPIAFGTDSGVSAHGDNAQEFALMVAAGMEPMAAIKSATAEAAKLLRADDEIGALAAGYRADIIAVDASPLDDIRTLESPSFVMKDGVVYRAPQ